MVVVVMGVTGAGKTTIGRALAAELGWRFADADDYHSAANVAKMTRGTPLTDADRTPWLAALHAIIAAALDRREPLVLACSALTAHYRDVLRGGMHPVRFVYLKASPGALRPRVAHRVGHFAGPALLESQFATLEEPTEDEALIVSASGRPEEILGTIRYAFGL